MKERQYIHSKTINFLSASGKAKKEDRREIIGILLSLLVIAAFIIIAFTIAIPMAKAAGDMVTSNFGIACLGKAMETRPLKTDCESDFKIDPASASAHGPGL
jgi:hypothetical protein